MDIRDYIEEDLLERFEFYNYNHALEIITQAFPEEWSNIVTCLRTLEITTADLRKAGGNETDIPKKFDDVLYPLDWKEIKIVPGYIDGHNIDFVKGRVAFDLEWNSKDQTFDRDLLAMRTYYDCDIISAGIIITRAEELNDVFKTVYDHDGKPIIRKYGASTTWMGKLLPRLESRRNGGCPVLAIGIKKLCIVDWREGYEDEHAE